MRKIVLAAVGFPSQPSAYFTSTTDATAPLKYSKRKVALHLCVLADFPLFSVFSFLYYFFIQTPLFMCSAQKFPQDAVKGGGVIKGWCGVRGEKVDG